MLRKFIDSLIILKYMSIVFSMAFVTLLIAMGYSFTKIRALYYLTIVSGIVEFLMIIMLSVERMRSAKQLGLIQRKEDFNNGVIVGDCILIENRMLAYKNSQLIESDYSNIKDASLIGTEGKYKVRLTIGGNQFDAVVGTQENAELLAGFLKEKCPNITFHDLKPRGKGAFRMLQSISQERPKV